MPGRLLPTFLPWPLYSGRERGSFVLVSFLWFVSLDKQRNERKDYFKQFHRAGGAFVSDRLLWFPARPAGGVSLDKQRNEQKANKFLLFPSPEGEGVGHKKYIYLPIFLPPAQFILKQLQIRSMVGTFKYFCKKNYTYAATEFYQRERGPCDRQLEN